MKHFNVTLLLFFLMVLSASAQKKAITLQEIWDNDFKANSMEALYSMKNGQQYSVLNVDPSSEKTSVDIYDYKTLQKVKTYVSSADFNEFENFSDYTFSADETKAILATEVEPIYRRSKKAKYFVYDSSNNSATAISDEKIQEPTFSPDGQKIAYVLNNDLYVFDMLTERTKRLTKDGAANETINGLTDWVYEEEFSFVRAFEWNSKSDRIAYLKFDETFVPEFSMDVYGSKLYQTQQKFKYPKAGELNSVVTLHIYDLLKTESKKVYLQEKEYEDFYIPRIQWTNDPEVLSAQYMNRHQNVLDLWLINANGYESKIVHTETDKAYVDVTFDLTFLKDNSFIWTSESSGNNHIYHYSNQGQLVKQVTNGNWEVTKYYGFDEVNRRLFYQSTENGSTNRGVYSINISGGNKKELSVKEGQSSASFSANHQYFINSFSSANEPPIYTLNDALNGKIIKTIVNNNDLASKLENYNLSKKEFSTISVNGNDLNMWMIKPSNFDSSKTYPLLMYQYSGPGSQSVANRWNGYNDYWYNMLAQQGIIVACVDGRGTGYKGAAFKKVTQKELGKYEVEDQIAAAKQLGSLGYIDANNIGIWGWSYGGFMSSNALLKGHDVFSMAIAVAPVTSWRFYDTIYTERYMTTPDENPSGYDDNSPINHVDKLKGDYLIVHGTGDDNVHVQNTMRMVEALIQADKQFDWMIYPDKNHGIYGGNTRLHLYKKMTSFIHQTIGGNSMESYKSSSSMNQNIKTTTETKVMPQPKVDSKSNENAPDVKEKVVPKTAEEIKATNKGSILKKKLTKKERKLKKQKEKEANKTKTNN